MTINLNIISHYSEKSIDIYDLEHNLINSINTTEIVTIDYDKSYLIYVSPYQESIDVTTFLDIINNLLTGATGYIWIFGIGILFILLLKGIKNHVK